MKLNQEWKFRHNDLSKLTLKQFIQNTIEEEQQNVLRDIPISELLDNTVNVQELRKEGYYRALAILNEVL